MSPHLPGVDVLGLHVDSWTLLGRLPLVLTLCALTLSTVRDAGLRRALLGLSGFASGMGLGVAIVPSILGALAGGVAGGAATLRALGAPLPRPLPVTMALAALVMVGRVGCLVNGCCFGMPARLPWAVTYPEGTIAALHHHTLGWTAEGAASLPVHPVQVYEALALLAILALLPPLARRLGQGSASLAGAGLYLLWRAGVDPWRGVVNTASSVVPAGPLSRFQWAALAASAACLAGAVWVRTRASTPVAPRPEPAWDRLALAWVAQLLGLVAAQRTLTPILLVVGAGSLALSAAALLPGLVASPARRSPLARVAAAGLFAAMVPVALRASEPGDEATGSNRTWVYAPDEGGSGKAVRVGETTTRRELTVLGSLGRGRYPTQVGWCGGRTTYADRSPVRLGAALSETTEQPDGSRSLWQLRLELLGDGWRTSEDRFESGGTVTSTASGVAYGALLGGLYVWDWEYAAVGLGAGFGASTGWDRETIPWFSLDVPLSIGDASVNMRWHLLPALYLRLGPRAFSLDLGTTATYQALDAPFVAIAMRPFESTWRLGVSGRYMQAPLFASELFLDGEFEAGGGRWGVRLAVPSALGLVGAVRYTTPF